MAARRALLGAGLLALIAAGCSWDAPHDNPLDPVNGGNVEGRVLTRRATGIADAEVQAPAADRFCRTDSAGEFALYGLPAGSLLVRVRAEGFVADSFRIDLARGRVDSATRYLNGQPRFAAFRVSSHVFGRGWPPEPLTFCRLRAEVDDPDGVQDIDSVWVEIAAVGFAGRLAWDPEDEEYAATLWSSELPGQSPETLVGQEVKFLVADLEGAVGAQSVCGPERIIYELPVPLFPSGGLDTLESDTTFAWRKFDQGFRVGYRAEVVRVEGGAPAGLVLARDATVPQDTGWRVPIDSLPPGDYYWTVEAIDAYGNSSRSAEELFHAR